MQDLTSFQYANTEYVHYWLSKNEYEEGSTDEIAVAISWACLMQSEVENGKKIADIAEDTFKKANIYNLDRYNVSYLFLIFSEWKHSGELSLWHKSKKNIV